MALVGALVRDARARNSTRPFGAASITRPEGFAGVYGFDAPTPADYGRHMDRWLAGSPDGTLMMCHPATSIVTGDAIAAQRVVEFDYLASDAFGDSLRRHGVVLARFDGAR